MLPQYVSKRFQRPHKRTRTVSVVLTLLRCPQSKYDMIGNDLGAMLFSWASRGRELWRRFPLQEPLYLGGQNPCLQISAACISSARIPSTTTAPSRICLLAASPWGASCLSAGKPPKIDGDILNQACHCQNRKPYDVAATSSS